MTTSKPSQPPLFADGSESDSLFDPTPLWPTPAVKDTGRDVESYMAMKRGMPGGERRTITQLTTAVKAGSISSRPAIPASHSLSPGSAWARKMTGISGRILRRWLPISDLGGVFSRMCTDTFRWGSTRCYLTWKRSATPAGRSLFRLVPSAPPTGATVSGFWPTPDVGMTQGGRSLPDGTSETGKTPDGRKVQVGLTNAVRMWPTPRASENENRQTKPTPSQLARTHGRSLAAEMGMFPTPRHEGFDAGSHRGKPDSLHAVVKMMPTPTARDWKDGSSVQNVPENGLLGRWSVNHSTTPGPGQKLSAAWVVRLMGYPDNYLDDLPPDPLAGDPDPA